MSPPAKAVVLHGPSGCGKSTLLGLLAGVLLPQAGNVSVMGQDWAARGAARRAAARADHVGDIFQQFNLLPCLSVLDNVNLPCRFSKLRRSRAPAGSAQRLLQRGALPQALWMQRAAELSVGQQRRAVPRWPDDGAVRNRLAQRLEPARHAAAEPGAHAQRHPAEFSAVGQRHRPRGRRAHGLGAADAVRGVPHRRRHQQREDGEHRRHRKTSCGVVGAAHLAGRFAASLAGLVAVLLAGPWIQTRCGTTRQLSAPTAIQWSLLGAVLLAGMLVGRVPGWRACRLSLADGPSPRS